MAKTNSQIPSAGSVGVIKTGASPGHAFVVTGVSADGNSVYTMEADGSNG